MITLFTLEVCPNCDLLKKTLDKNGIEYTTLDAQSIIGQTELKVNGCFASEMPVIMIGDGDEFLEQFDIFFKGNVKEEIIERLQRV